MKKSHKEKAGQPVLAVMDIGAHLARLQIAQITADGGLETLENVSQPLPLGADLYGPNPQVSAANTRLVGETVCDFNRLLRDYRVTTCKAVVTGALREAANLEMFQDRVRQLSGVTLEVLEETEEIRLLFRAIREELGDRYGFSRCNAVVCVIGPDVSQVLFLRHGHIHSAETVRLGTLRLRAELGGPVSPQRLRELTDPFVGAVINGLARMAAGEKPELFIAVGSAVRALVELGSTAPRQPVISVSRQGFAQRFRAIAGKPLTTLAARTRLGDAVAESLEPCANMLDHFFDITAADRLVVPMISTRDALLRDLLREATGGADDFIPEILSAARHLGGKYQFDHRHAETVAELALTLFDALKDVHGLGARDRLLLELASLLHDIGFFVSSRQHHKHSWYLLGNSEIPGIAPAEQQILAVVARYHRRATPRLAHPEFAALAPASRVRVSKLAALLRVADALDRSHRNKVHALRVELKEDKVELHADEADDLTLERFGLRKKADLFRELFGLRVTLAE